LADLFLPKLTAESLKTSQPRCQLFSGADSHTTDAKTQKKRPAAG